MRWPSVALVVALGCGSSREPADAGAYLAHVAALDADARARVIASWELDRATWDRLVVPPFGELYEDYRAALALPLALPEGTYRSRPHFAGDPANTLGQDRARWLLPVLFASEVVTVDGRPLDLVLFRDAGRWYALTGIDRAIRARVDRRDPACGVRIDAPAPTKVCRDASWAVATAAFRTDDARFHRACAIAATACAKPSP